jgi:hypothetical protein
MLRSLRNAFVSGLLLLAPVGVTIFVIDFLIQRVGAPTRRFIFFFIPPDRTTFVWLEYGLYIAAVFAVVVLITLLAGSHSDSSDACSSTPSSASWTTCRWCEASTTPSSRSGTPSSSRKKPSSSDRYSLNIHAKGVWVLGFLTGKGKGRNTTKDPFQPAQRLRSDHPEPDQRLSPHGPA